MWERCDRPYVLSDIELDEDFDIAKHQLTMEKKHENDSKKKRETPGKGMKEREST